jgi:hypothetical protein
MSLCTLSSENNICAPSKKYKTRSCISTDILIELARAYNTAVDKRDQEGISEKIDLSVADSGDEDKLRASLISQLTNRLKKICDNDQTCWLKRKFLKYMNKNYKFDLETNTFRPIGPEGQHVWLNTHNINQVMEQYENKYKEFKFFGAVPLDFEEMKQLGMMNINFEDLVSEGKTKIGLIINLDTHDQSGSHWVGLYANLKEGQIYFFDSYGGDPDNDKRMDKQRRIKKFMDKIQNYLEQNGIPVDRRHNETRHQMENSECGVYSIYFVIKLVQDQTFEQVTKKSIPDQLINKCRLRYFRTGFGKKH